MVFIKTMYKILKKENWYVKHCILFFIASLLKLLTIIGG